VEAFAGDAGEDERLERDGCISDSASLYSSLGNSPLSLIYSHTIMENRGSGKKIARAHVARDSEHQNKPVRDGAAAGTGAAWERKGAIFRVAQ
jgi:hypothetical protein